MNPKEAAQSLFSRIKNIRLLPPRDSRFYELFTEMGEIIYETSGDLVKIFNAPISERQEIEEAIHSRFIKCGRLSDSTEDLLNIAQHPPFERPDIMELTRNLMRVVKFIKHAANRYVIYNFPTSDKEMRELAPVINLACQEIATTIKRLQHNRNLDSFYYTITRFEIQADNIYHQGLSRRFAEIRQDRIDTEQLIDNLGKSEGRECTSADILRVNKSIVEYTRHVAIFFILREVYEELEKASDACTHVAATMRRMVAGNV